MYIILTIIIAIVGIFMILKPEVIYDITESWKNNRSGEPSDLYLLSTKIGGILCLLLGIAGAVILLVLD